MGRILGNIGGIEVPNIDRTLSRVDRQRLPDDVRQAFKMLMKSNVETRIALEKLERELERTRKGTANLIQNVVNIVNEPPDIFNGFPYGVALPFPFFILPSAEFFPGGRNILNGTAYRVTFCEIMSDPTAAPSTGDTTFTLKNHLTAPTSTGTITIPTGQTRAETSTINVSVSASQRLYVVAPAALNGIQNLYSFWIILDRAISP